MHKSFAVNAGWAVLLSIAAALGAAEKKIVINAIDNHNGWAFTDEAISEYRSAAGQSADIVLARSPTDMARETANADGVIGGLSRDLFLKAKKLKWVQTYSAGVEGISLAGIHTGRRSADELQDCAGTEHRGPCHGLASSDNTRPDAVFGG